MSVSSVSSANWSSLSSNTVYSVSVSTYLDAYRQKLDNDNDYDHDNDNDLRVAIFKLAEYYYHKCQYNEAAPLYEEYLEKTYKIVEDDKDSSWSLDYINIVLSESNLAVCYIKLEHYDKADSMYEQCLKRLTFVVLNGCDEHYDIVTSMSYLALCYTNIG